VGNQDLNNPGDIISGDCEGDTSISRMIEREQRAIYLSNLDVPRRLRNSPERLPIEWLIRCSLKHPLSCLPQQSDHLGELVEV
jgi:hypothetical protein